MFRVLAHAHLRVCKYHHSCMLLEASKGVTGSTKHWGMMVLFITPCCEAIASHILSPAGCQLFKPL
ncbi:MAG: hypothetical protein RL571_235 [Pseudomonadota bacterium]|jgi:hypothetical protein